jgi:hypothetical protein
VPDAGPMESLIHALSDSDSTKRESAARKIFHVGRELAKPSVEAWMAVAELAQILVFLDPGFPATTVGVAVQPANFDRLRAANGSPALADVPPDQDAKEFELHFGHNVRLDILTTRDPAGAGAIARFLEKFGEGIQQVEIAVQEVDRATEILRMRFGQASIYPATRAGADGSRVNFFLVTPPQGKKVLIELVEEKTGKA